jgi:dihydroorotate dehydrogenase electron transfer subunit
MISAMGISSHEVLRVDELGADNYVLYLEGPFPEARPGQFCMLRRARDWPCMLPRPFSYFDLVPSDGSGPGYASFLIKAVGPGTTALADVRPGDRVDVTGPLGNHFEASSTVEPICIAGGVGLAPFLLWVRERIAAGATVPLVYGAATSDLLVARDEFPDATDWRLATDDGSLGFHGNVLELAQSLIASGELPAEAPVYCCGPDPMMEAVAAWCGERGTPCSVSLETYMACGYGVCNGCSVTVSGTGRFEGKRYSRTCIDGPVYRAEELSW